MKTIKNDRMPDYSKAKIYAIRAPGTDKVYIGSTTAHYLNSRLSQHKWDAEHRNVEVSSKEILQHENAYIELIEAFPCETKDQLNKREGEIIRATPNCVNKNIAGRKASERFKEKSEERNAWYREWYAKNKDKVNAAKRERRKTKAV